MSDHENELVLMVGGTHNQCVNWAYHKGIDPHKLKIVDFSSQLRGLGKVAGGIPIWLIGTYYEREDLDAIIDEAKCQGMEIKYGHNWRD